MDDKWVLYEGKVYRIWQVCPECEAELGIHCPRCDQTAPAPGLVEPYDWSEPLIAVKEDMN